MLETPVQKRRARAVATVERRAHILWIDHGRGGHGYLRGDSRAFSPLPVSLADTTGSESLDTTPGELLAAAVCSSFVVALADLLARQARPRWSSPWMQPVRSGIGTAGEAISGLHLRVRGRGAGLEPESFVDCADLALACCPISHALSATVTVTVDADLARERNAASRTSPQQSKRLGEADPCSERLAHASVAASPDDGSSSDQRRRSRHRRGRDQRMARGARRRAHARRSGPSARPPGEGRSSARSMRARADRQPQHPVRKHDSARARGEASRRSRDRASPALDRALERDRDGRARQQGSPPSSAGTSPPTNPRRRSTRSASTISGTPRASSTEATWCTSRATPRRATTRVLSSRAG